MLKEFLKTTTGVHLYSFAKTYITVFISIYLTLNSVMDNPEMKVLADLDLVNVNILATSAKGALIAVVRNLYKLLTENK